MSLASPFPSRPVLRLLTVTSLLGAGGTATVRAASTPLPRATPESVGMNSEALERIPERMRQFVTEEKVSGAVTLVARRGKLVHLAAVGEADREQHRAMKTDSLVWLASQGKPTTAVAVMILVDEGKVSLDDPISKYLPEYANVKLKSGQPPAHPPTVRQMLSHTAGLAQPFRDPGDGAIPLAQYAVRLGQRPLEFEPGSAFEYGYGLTVAGRIVEIVSGKPFDVFLQERIFGPLGMKDTTFHPSEAQHRRIAKTYMGGPGGKGLVPAYNPFHTPDASVKRTPEPSGGLFSTAADMARFYQMVMNGGELEGTRILSPQAVKTMLTPQVAGGKTLNYALGWFVFPSNPSASGPQLNGFGHGGAFATDGVFDPDKQVVAVLMIQRLMVPNGGDIGGTFRKMVAEAVMDGSAR